MVRAVIEGALRFRFLIVGVAAIVLVVGVVGVRTMPTDVLPELSAPTVEVQTEALGLSAEEVEQMITVPLEADLLNGVAWLQSIRSASVTGMSSIVMTFEPGTDLIRARQMVQERLTQAHALPNVSSPPVMLQPVSTASRVLMVGLSSNTVSLIDLSVLARWVVRPRLMGVPGVANVAVWGLRDRQLQVQVGPQQLDAQAVRLWDVLETTGEALWVSPLTFLNSSTPGTGGFIDTPTQRFGIRHLSPVSTAADLGRVAVTGTPWLLEDVANVVEDHQPLIGDALVDGRPGLVLVAEKFPWADTVTVTEGLQEALRALQPGLSGVTVDTSALRPASYIGTARDRLLGRLLMGLVAAGVLLWALWGGLRRALAVLVPVAVSIAAALVVLSLLGAGMNAMVLVGLVVALAALVDDAGGAMRAGSSRFAGDPASRPPATPESAAVSPIQRSSNGASAVSGHGVAIVLVLAATVLLVSGLAGALARPVATAYALAILASTLVALTLTPALVSLLFGDRTPAGPIGGGLMAWLGRVHGRILAPIVARPGWPLVAAGVVGAGALVVAVGRPAAPLPPLLEPDVVVDWAAAAGTSHPEMLRVTGRLADELEALPGVGGVTAHVGRAVTGDEVVGISQAKLWLRLAPQEDRAATIAAVQEVVAGYPGFRGHVLSYHEDRLRRVTGPPVPDLLVRVYGSDYALLQRTAEQVARAVRGVDGVGAVSVAATPLEPTLEVRVDLAAAQRYGLKPGDVRRAATTLVNGITVGSVFEAQKVFDVVVRGESGVRASPADLRALLIDTPGGGLVPLGEVAEVAVRGAPAVIHRDAVSRYLDVSAEVVGRDAGAVARDVRAALASVSVPLEFRSEVIEGVSAQGGPLRTSVWVVALLIVVLLLFQSAMGSWRLGLTGLLTLPAAGSGALAFAILWGGGVTVPAVAGVIAALGLSARHTIQQVRSAQSRQRGTSPEARKEAAVAAALHHTPTVTTTALATAAALLPLALAPGLPGLELIRPAVLALLGGVLSTTLVDLLVQPAVYAALGVQAAEETVRVALSSGRGGRSTDAAI